MTVPASELRLINATTLQAWLEADTRRLPIPRVSEALNWARSMWRRADAAASTVVVSVLDPDRVYALVRVAREDVKCDPRKLQAWYEVLEKKDWPNVGFDEKRSLLCDLAYVLSRQYRRHGDQQLSWVWEKRTVDLVQQLPSVADFISLKEQQQTDQLRARFLSDPSVLLALCARLPNEVNLNPAEALQQIISTHRYVAESGTLRLQEEERSWFLVQLEILAAYGHKHSGNFAEASRWLNLAATRCDVVTHPDIPRARIEFGRCSIAYERHDYTDAGDALPHLAETFERFGMKRNALLCVYLEGVVLKERGLPAEALARLQLVATDDSSEIEQWIRGLALIFTAEIYVKQGELEKGFEILSRAWALVGESRCATAVGHFHCAKGEILRDLGHLDAAVESYRLGVATYESARFKALEAQVRVILAETLLALGRDREALAEIATALPIIETLGLMTEAVIAVALLRESLSRQSADREALMALRRALEHHNGANRS